MADHIRLGRGIDRGACMEPGRLTRDTWQQTCSSPATHFISSLLDSMVRTRSPLGSTFSLIAERWLAWMTWPFASAVLGVVFVFMARIFAARFFPVHVQISEIRT
ncbi:hypothetical protein J2W88_002989 [Acidovorax delafieldii]|uniref:Uncharacterized protein n=2 Tax=Acidovorax delafieldii TaxID=47920 RepID=A0AAJ2BUL1_ACIDE|nr:hypothetical protein [Acidovorax delafieldii]MDR6767708.1 hypothetical protein [Acidovorax delafieldii]MDR6839690.1 hypothetical protein [Acidovorax delafieldii]MDR7368409.1 hypothetical protein [Acidovorax delafieldii]